jgi:hypothetical protein
MVLAVPQMALEQQVHEWKSCGASLPQMRSRLVSPDGEKNMPRVTKEVERKRIEKVVDSIECDGCGRKADDHNSVSGFVDWEKGLSTHCYLMDDRNEDEEVILCPDCFRSLKFALPFARSLAAGIPHAMRLGDGAAAEQRK